MRNMIANLVAEIVNGPTFIRSLTITLLKTLVAAAIQIKINANMGEAQFLHLFLVGEAKQKKNKFRYVIHEIIYEKYY